MRGALFELRAFSEVRRYYRMLIDMDGAAAGSRVAGRIRGRDVSSSSDARAFHAALNEAFADEWNFVADAVRTSGARLRVHAPDFDPTLWFIVREGDEIAAVLRGDADRSGLGLDRRDRRAQARGASAGSGLRSCATRSASSIAGGRRRVGARSRRPESHRRDAALRARGHARRVRSGRVREGAHVSRLRAKCPDCKTFTAVALGPEYECHSCGASSTRGHGARAAGLG